MWIRQCFRIFMDDALGMNIGGKYMKKIITFTVILFVMASSHLVFADSGIINAS